MITLLAQLSLLALAIYHGLSSARNLRRAHKAELAQLEAEGAAQLLYLHLDGARKALEISSPGCSYDALLRAALKDFEKWKK